MTSSIGSILNDDTPTQDSGVQLLDSETDLNDSMISSTGLEFETFNEGAKPVNTEVTISDAIPDLLMPIATMNSLSKSDIEPINEDEKMSRCGVNPDLTSSTIEADMMSSIHSTFDTENTEIVYRRKIKKTKSAPKKRVSFHEDILKSTRTDNIHIEHGFITYKGRQQKPNARYSWSDYNNQELDAFDDSRERQSHHVYRNACSEVLDYGKTEIHDDDEKSTGKQDKSGVFEYPPLNAERFYRCSCSSSSSIESGSSGENNSNNSSNDSKTDDKRSYKQSKSSSCDCIGNNSNNIEIGKGTCFFSEPNIGNNSVWSKEKKPKNSCLKKSKQTNVVQERKIDSNVKKFNIHQISTSVIKDNGKMIIGSLKDIFGISLPERGVPEGSEDNPEECIPQETAERVEQDYSFLQKVGIFKPNPSKVQKLSKSLDGGLGKQTKTFVHNVDEQLRRGHDEDLFVPSSSNSRKSSLKTESSVEEKEADEDLTISCGNPRNKYIINCESTVFEHTGTIEIPETISMQDNYISPAFTHNPFKKKLSNLFSSIAGNNQKSEFDVTVSDADKVETRSEGEGEDEFEKCRKLMESSIVSTSSDKNSSIISDISISSNTTTSTNHNYDIKMSNAELTKKSKHLSSPIRKKRERVNQPRMSPDLFNRDLFASTSQASRNSSSLLSEDFDDILTVTTEDKTDNDIVIVDYEDVKNEMENNPCANSYYLKLPSIMTSSTTSTSSKTSLINRFLRNVTQKKILEASIKRNNFFQGKLKNERKLFGGNLYVKGVKPKDDTLIKNLNDEIDMEIEMGCNSLEFEEEEQQSDKGNRLSVCSDDNLSFDAGIGELRTEMFDAKRLQLFRDPGEILLKVFKLYAGYSNEGNICAVLVFLTDKTIYVVELIRNKLSNKFVLPYAELDVILMGPMGNTVLLSNGARDMQVGFFQ